MQISSGVIARSYPFVSKSSAYADLIGGWLVHVIFVSAFLAAIFSGEVRASAPLPGEVTFGLGGSDEEVTESLDTLFPLYAPKDSLLFFNPKVTFSDQANPRVSLGLGFRHLFEDPQIILGGNIFYDNFDTENDHRINQLGLGAEMLSRWVDLRANIYLPDNKR